MGDVLLYEQLQLFAQGLYRNLSLKIPHKFGKDISLSHYLPGLFETSHLVTLTQLCSTLDVAIFSLNCSKRRLQYTSCSYRASQTNMRLLGESAHKAVSC